MSGQSQPMVDATSDDGSRLNQRIGTQCAITAASIVLIIAAIAVIALL